MTNFCVLCETTACTKGELGSNVKFEETYFAEGGGGRVPISFFIFMVTHSHKDCFILQTTILVTAYYLLRRKKDRCFSSGLTITRRLIATCEPQNPRNKLLEAPQGITLKSLFFTSIGIPLNLYILWETSSYNRLWQCRTCKMVAWSPGVMGALQETRVQRPQKHFLSHWFVIWGPTNPTFVQCSEKGASLIAFCFFDIAPR